MENYKKGKNVEEPLDRDTIPIPYLPTNFLWMQVRGGSKIRNLLRHALNEFPSAKHVVWTGFGQSVGKAVTCAELMKKEYNHTLHQITKICYRWYKEYWDPLIPELDEIVVRKQLPMIHIYLSMEPLDIEELGYQLPTAMYDSQNLDQSSTKRKTTPLNEPNSSNSQPNSPRIQPSTPNDNPL